MLKKNLKYNSYFSLFVMMLIMVLSLAVHPSGADFYSLNTFKDIKLPLCTILLLTYFFIKSLTKTKTSFSVVDVLILLFAALSFTSAVYARNPQFAINVGFNWVVYYGVFKLFQNSIKQSFTKKYLIISTTVCLVFSLCIFSLLILLNADYSNGFFNILSGAQLQEVSSLYKVHRNNVSSLLVIAIGIPFYFIAKSKNKVQLSLSLILLFFFSLVLMITRSRGSLLAFTLIVTIILAIFWLKKIVYRNIIIACLSTIIFTSYITIVLQNDAENYIGLLNPFYGVLSEGGDDRLKMWEISYQLFKEKPILGYGAGSWEFEYQKYGAGDLKGHHYGNSHFLHSHSYYVNIFFCYGIVGGIVFLLLIIYYPIHRILTKIKLGKITLSDLIWFSGIVAFLIISLFYGTPYGKVNYMLGQPVMFFAFLGCLYANDSKFSSRGINVIIVLLLLVSTFYYSICWNNSQIVNKSGIAFKEKKFAESASLLQKTSNSKFGYIGYNCNVYSSLYWAYRLQKKHDKAIENIKKAIQRHPYNFTYHRNLGDVLFFQKKIRLAKKAYQKSLLYNCDFIPASIGLLKCEAVLGNEKQVNIIKRNLLYINDYINQYEQNQQSWSQHIKLTSFYNKYKQFKKQVDKIKIAK